MNEILERDANPSFFSLISKMLAQRLCEAAFVDPGFVITVIVLKNICVFFILSLYFRDCC